MNTIIAYQPENSSFLFKNITIGWPRNTIDCVRGISGIDNIRSCRRDIVAKWIINHKKSMINEEKELKDILLCFLEDNNRGEMNASQSIADGRYCDYNEEALQDAMSCLNELFKLK